MGWSREREAAGEAVRESADLVAQGLAFDPLKGILYVSSTEDNAIYAVRNAAVAITDNGTGKIAVQDPVHLQDRFYLRGSRRQYEHAGNMGSK